MIRKISFACAVVVALTACASANKRLEQGQDLERSGRPAEAAERYIQALKKNSRLDSARAGLKSSGQAAIDQYLQVAADPNSNADRAAEQFLAVDDLQRRALEVGIFLVPPTDYDTRKRAAFDRGIATVLGAAPLHVNQGQYAEALNRLQRAATAYQPSVTQAGQIAMAGAGVSLSWAKADTAAGSFRSGYTRVEPLQNLQGMSSAQMDEVRNLMAASLQRGTKRIAVVPPWTTVAARVQLPDEALLALGDAMLNPPWTTPPQFVAVFPPDQTERDLRRMGMARRTLTTLEAGRFARAVGADYVVVAEVDSVRREDYGVRSTRRTARTRQGQDTAYTIEEGSSRIYVQTTFTIVDQNGQNGQDYRSVSSSLSAPFTRGRYAGDWRTLDLRQAERELFERGSGERDLARSFAAAVSPRLADGIFGEVLRRIP